MANFLHRLIPASMGVWLLFFLLPAVLAFLGQLWLCRHVRRLLQFLPAYIAAGLLLCVLLYKHTGFLAPLIGGFAALFLLGSVFFILLGSALGWLVHGLGRGGIKKILKSCTFWFLLLGLVVIIRNLMGLDDKNIIMIGLNPILNILSSSDLCAAIADVPYLWHILSFLTMLFYGAALDLFRHLLKKK